jgi:hypothetical protein
MKETTTIYWSSNLDNQSQIDQWPLKNPEPVVNYFLNKNITEDPRTSIFNCPASAAFFKNLFVFKSNLSDRCDWPEGYLSEIVNTKLGKLDGFNNKIPIIQERKSAISGYIDLIYSINFVMFADKPLKIRLSSPSYPPSAPSNSAMFTSGEFDFGRWFRPAVLNWFVPLDNTEFVINEGDGLFYAQALTDEKIVFKRFVPNDQIRFLTWLMGQEGRGLKLESRYQLAEGKNIQQQILDEIKKTVID